MLSAIARLLAEALPSGTFSSSVMWDMEYCVYAYFGMTQLSMSRSWSLAASAVEGVAVRGTDALRLSCPLAAVLGGPHQPAFAAGEDVHDGAAPSAVWAGPPSTRAAAAADDEGRAAGVGGVKAAPRRAPVLHLALDAKDPAAEQTAEPPPQLLPRAPPPREVAAVVARERQDETIDGAIGGRASTYEECAVT